MGTSSLDDKIAQQINTLKNAKALFTDGEITQDQYQYQKDILEELYNQKDLLNVEEKPPSFILMKSIVTALFIGGLFLGSFHLLIGSKVNGLMISKRASFGYSEMIIDTDKITSLYKWEAKENYPLSYDICLKEDFY